MIKYAVLFMNNNVGFWGREGKILIIKVNVSTVTHHVKSYGSN